MKSIGKVAAFLALTMVSAAPAIAASVPPSAPGAALSRGAVQGIAANARVGKKMQDSNQIFGLPVIVVLLGVAAAAAVIVAVADSGSNSP